MIKEISVEKIDILYSHFSIGGYDSIYKKIRNQVEEKGVILSEEELFKLLGEIFNLSKLPSRYI